MKSFKGDSKVAIVNVALRLKKDMLDASSSTILQTLNRLGFEGVVACEETKTLTLHIQIPPDCKKEEQWLKDQAEKMCQTLLANPVSQDYQITVMADQAHL